MRVKVFFISGTGNNFIEEQDGVHVLWISLANNLFLNLFLVLPSPSAAAG